MNFIVATKPLCDGLNMIVLNQNVSAYYQKSCVAQITASDNTLTINTEAEGLLSELKLVGKANEQGVASTIVDCITFKQIVNTIDASTITIEFIEGGIKLCAGKSKFSISQVLDPNELTLRRPYDVTESSDPKVLDIHKDSWKFVKENQLYAISKNFMHPVYTYMWVSDTGAILTGDVTNGIFTQSTKNDLGITCLLKDTVVNLLESLPQDSHIYNVENHFVILAKTDSYSVTSEFIPVYESNPDVGSYNSDVIFSILNIDEESYLRTSVSALTKVLNQIELLNKGNKQTIPIEFGPQNIRFIDSYVDAEIPCTGNFNGDTQHAEFKIKFLKAALSHFDKDDIRLSLVYQNGTVSGLTVATDELSVVIAAIDD